MAIDINKHEVDIDTLFKQNELDLVSIKELYRKLEQMEKKISQIKYINEVIGDKLKKEYESLKDLIQNGTVQPVPGQPEISQTELNNKFNATATKQASSGSGEYRDVTADDVTLINSTLNIDSNGYKLTTSNQWDGIRLNNLPTESKITLVQSNTGQCMWYMYKYDDSYMYVLCIGKGNGEHGKVYKLSITTNSATQINTIEMTTIPNPGDILKIVVSGATQTLYCNDIELCTLTDCNTVGISNQKKSQSPYVTSKWTILE